LLASQRDDGLYLENVKSRTAARLFTESDMSRFAGLIERQQQALDGLRGEESIAALCRREGIAESLYYNWSKEFLEAGKKRLAGDTARAATSDEVKALRKESRELKEVVAEQVLELRLLKKSMIADGGDDE
jgi:transposase